ncbi:hypothetical protein [Robertmurraya korlensis]|nr:hypothetical protein [Robertmurraya korlensis]
MHLTAINVWEALFERLGIDPTNKKDQLENLQIKDVNYIFAFL